MNTRFRLIIDRIVRSIAYVFTSVTGIIFVVLFSVVFFKAFPVLKTTPLKDLLFSGIWQPMKGNFGLLPFLAGTASLTILSLILAVPICLLASIFISEYLPARFRKSVSVLIDLLAGVPSVIFGFWGVVAVVPLIRDHLAPLLGIRTSGYCILSGGIVLAIMVSPMIIQISSEMIRTVSTGIREASLALGASQWQTVKKCILRKAFPGLGAAVLLGFSRAVGETIAVMMVVGNVAVIPKGLFSPAYPLTALIANNYGELLSIPSYEHALMAAAFFLLVIIVLFNICGRWIIDSVKKRSYTSVA